MQKFLRYLRIAFSATCGIACVLLIALWVRSHYIQDNLTLTIDSRIYELDTYPGLFAASTNVDTLPIEFNWEYSSQIAAELKPNAIPTVAGVYYPFIYGKWSSYFAIRVPHWFLVIAMASLASATWIRRLKWRFSLRTLLIATTLIAVVLGLIVWLR